MLNSSNLGSRLDDYLDDYRDTLGHDKPEVINRNVPKICKCVTKENIQTGESLIVDYFSLHRRLTDKQISLERPRKVNVKYTIDANSRLEEIKRLFIDKLESLHDFKELVSNSGRRVISRLFRIPRAF